MLKWGIARGRGPGECDDVKALNLSESLCKSIGNERNPTRQTEWIESSIPARSVIVGEELTEARKEGRFVSRLPRTDNGQKGGKQGESERASERVSRVPSGWTAAGRGRGRGPLQKED